MLTSCSNAGTLADNKTKLHSDEAIVNGENLGDSLATPTLLYFAFFPRCVSKALSVPNSQNLDGRGLARNDRISSLLHSFWQETRVRLRSDLVRRLLRARGTGFVQCRRVVQHAHVVNLTDYPYAQDTEVTIKFLHFSMLVQHLPSAR